MFKKDIRVMTFTLNDSRESSVLIIGNSLLMEGISTRLTRQNYPELICLDDIDGEFEKYLEISDPKLIIFEFGSKDTFRFINLLRERPKIHLLAVDGACNQVIVFKCQKRDTRTMGEFLKIINEITRGE